MNEMDQPPATDENDGLFKKYPKLPIILIAVVAYGMLLGMCAFVAVLVLRG